MAVTSLISGGVTDTGASVVAEVGAGVSCRLVYATNSGLTSPSYSSAVVSDADGFVTLTVNGLTAATTYYYGIEVTGSLDAARGQLKTLPAPGATATFTICHSTCTGIDGAGSAYQSNHRVFDAIAARDPLMFVLAGDMGYNVANGAGKATFQANWRDQRTAARPAALYAKAPLVHCWSDHDFGSDNADGTSQTNKAVAATAWRQMFPHHTLPASDATYYAFTVGRFRFIVTDLRYFRSPNDATDNASKTMLGATQKAWLKDELLAAKNNPLTFWINEQVWPIDSPFSGIDTDLDHWGGFATERTELETFMSSNGIRNVVVLSGDAHMLAYMKAGSLLHGAKRVYQAAALDATPLTRGSNWAASQQGRGQYAALTVTDNGTSVDVAWRGYSVDGTTGAETQVMADDFTVTYTAHPVKVWNGSSWVARPVKVWNGSSWVERPLKTY